MQVHWHKFSQLPCDCVGKCTQNNLKNNVEKNPYIRQQVQSAGEDKVNLAFNVLQ